MPPVPGLAQADVACDRMRLSQFWSTFVLVSVPDMHRGPTTLSTISRWSVFACVTMLLGCTQASHGPTTTASISSGAVGTSGSRTSLFSLLDDNSDRVLPVGAPIPVGGGHYKLGDPYWENGLYFVPKVDKNYDQTGLASWMAEHWHGRRTANHEVHDSTALVTAHPTLPIPSYVRVTNLENGRELVLRVNDRGPFKRGRILDVSKLASRFLAFRDDGLARVRVQYLAEAPISGETTYEDAFLAEQPWAHCTRDARGRISACRVDTVEPVVASQ